MSDIKAARDEILDRRRGNKQPQPVKPRSDPDWEQSGSGSIDPRDLPKGRGVYPRSGVSATQLLPTVLIQTFWLNSCT